MNFFRKHFTTLLIICVALSALALASRYIKNICRERDMEREMAQESTVKNSEIPFTHQGNLSVLDKDGKNKMDFEIEFATGEYETALGLMYRNSMQSNRAMLFVFPEEEMRSFWMENTYISLDIIYINKNKEIVSISKNATPLSRESRPSEAPAMYVLEVNGGICDKYGIEKGDKITFEKLK